MFFDFDSLFRVTVSYPIRGHPGLPSYFMDWSRWNLILSASLAIGIFHQVHWAWWAGEIPVSSLHIFFPLSVAVVQWSSITTFIGQAENAKYNHVMCNHARRWPIGLYIIHCSKIKKEVYTFCQDWIHKKKLPVYENSVCTCAFGELALDSCISYTSWQ